MANVAKGDNARDEVISTRFTTDERRQLEAIYGKASRGVHAIVIAALKEPDSEQSN